MTFADVAHPRREFAFDSGRLVNQRSLPGKVLRKNPLDDPRAEALSSWRHERRASVSAVGSASSYRFPPRLSDGIALHARVFDDPSRPFVVISKL
jgi:hypothetical protein